MHDARARKVDHAAKHGRAARAAGQEGTLDKRAEEGRAKWEARYLFLNAIANQLRYPNNHTHYFSCALLYLFYETTEETVQEQITRVLVERLIVHRPHPWGLLVTFIELIKNPRYNFWWALML